MKRHHHTLSAAALGAAALILACGCTRQTRGTSDASQQMRAASPSEGGGSSTAHSAGQSENFGDTRAKTKADGVSPSASPTGLSQDASPAQPAPPSTPPVKQENQQPVK